MWVALSIRWSRCRRSSHAGLSTAADITISDVDVPPMLEQFDLEGGL